MNDGVGTIAEAEKKEEEAVHPLGGRARVLLSSVFGPYARDDEYGSRSINPMELYHNQVTRTQGPFSLRMFHRSWGLMMIQANVNAPCALLDFPTLDRFIQEIREHPYDVVGISAIMPNIGKVQKMCRLIREHLPQAAIVVGGHIANAPGLEKRIDADHIIRGEGVRWFRRFLGEQVDRPIRHALILSAVKTRAMGLEVRKKKGEVAATLIPSVGCPMGCNFCATSAMFGGKGKFVNFYETGDELFRIMEGLETQMEVRSFFVMDENFLLHRQRALRLLALMEEHGKSWSLYVFSSARVLQSYTIEQLVGLGISWVWMGLEGKSSQYVKLKGVDTLSLIQKLQANGIRVLGSSIIGLEEHTSENLREAIEYSISHETDFHQFMLYTPIPGTPLHAELLAKGALLKPGEYDDADIHGQFTFNYKHPHLQKGEETQFLIEAFERDFQTNGPSILRIARTLLKGRRKYKNHPDKRIRARFAWEARELKVTFPAMLWAAASWYRKSRPELCRKLTALLNEIQREIGWKAKLAAPLAGRFVLAKLRQEDQRLKEGWTCEPPSFYEMNDPMLALFPEKPPEAARIGWV
ncbi:MAG: cobalamin B12-binding domain-containing protein [Candidatus Omnitrophica bacterium]|nr:cobalamin B12-binding domain-containing protein [Candidatus Omnitrophota bacterium]